MNIKRSAVCLLCMMAAAMCAGCSSSDNTDTFCTLRNAQLLGPLIDEALNY